MGLELKRAETIEWATPWPVFLKWHKEFSFTLDPCATADNTKCGTYYTIQQNGLAQNWQGHTAYVNPPYADKEITRWLQKGWQESHRGATVVFLLPAKTGSRWFHAFCTNDGEVISGRVRFLKGRIKFGDSENSAPFASMLVIFYPAVAHWAATVRRALKILGGQAKLSEIYTRIALEFADTVAARPHWKARVRATLQTHFTPVTRGVWRLKNE